MQRGDEQDPMVTALLEGPSGAGKTSLAATVALESGFPFARIICPADSMVSPFPRDATATSFVSMLMRDLGRVAIA